MPSLFVNSFGSQEKLKIQSGCRFGLERGPKPRVFQGCSPHPWSTQDSCAGGLVITSCWAGFDLVRVFFDATEGEHLPVVNVDYLPESTAIQQSDCTSVFQPWQPTWSWECRSLPLKHSHLQPLIKGIPRQRFANFCYLIYTPWNSRFTTPEQFQVKMILSFLRNNLLKGAMWVFGGRIVPKRFVGQTHNRSQMKIPYINQLKTSIYFLPWFFGGRVSQHFGSTRQ